MIIAPPPFDPNSFCSAVQKYRVTFCYVPPPVVVVLAEHPAVDKYDMRSLKVLYSAAAPLGEHVMLQVKERWRKKGWSMTIGQGTQASGVFNLTRIVGICSVWAERGDMRSPFYTT
jgi:4-coumarate--CoA ligase